MTVATTTATAAAAADHDDDDDDAMAGILKEACLLVRARTKGMAGTARGSKEMGRTGAGGDVSRKIDLAAEKAVMEVLRKHKVGATVIGEECGVISNEGSGFVVVDGIDGTTNAVRRVPFYCCSLAYATGPRLSAVTDAAIIDLVTGDLYHASRRRGAFCNGRRIRTRKSTESMVMGINLSKIDERAARRLAPVIARSEHTRQLGATALEMCYVASGRLDAFIDVRGKARITDIAAACLIVEEAGGVVCSPSAGDDDGSALDADLDIKTRVSLIAAGSKKIFRRLWPAKRGGSTKHYGAQP